MALTERDIGLAITHARALPFVAPRIPVESFYATTLGMNAAVQTATFPDPDPTGQLAIAIARLTKAREEILQINCDVPGFVVYDDVHGVACIAGLGTYLAERGIASNIAQRFVHRAKIREKLRTLTQGHHLEAVGAAIMAATLSSGKATRGSGDQGLDALGWKELVKLDAAFAEGGVMNGHQPPDGEKVYLLASSKAAISATRSATPLLNPAHIRELVGGWLIQRSPVGMWKGLGIKMLTPLQMILITTYRLSSEAKALCRDLGIQVWGVPELVYLICLHAPSPVFSGVAPYALNSRNFRNWWVRADVDRITPPP